MSVNGYRNTFVKNVEILYSFHGTFHINSQRSFSESCVFPRRYGGILRCTPLKIRSSSISKPRSAITESPLSNNIPLCLVNALSEMFPGNKDETKVIVPSGEILSEL